MAKEKIVNVDENEIEEVKVDMTSQPEIPQEPEETNKEKAFRIAKKLGNGLFKAAKTATCAVGAVVIGAVAVGVAIAKATEGKSDSSDSEVGEDDNIDATFEEVSTTEAEDSIRDEFNI